MFKENKTEFPQGFSPNPLEAILWAREKREIETSEKYGEAEGEREGGGEKVEWVKGEIDIGRQTILPILIQFSCPKSAGYELVSH